MKNNTVLTIIKIALYVLGFPLLLALAVVNCSKVYGMGSSYGFMCWVGVIVVGLFGLIYAVTSLCVQHSKKLKIKTQTMIITLVATISMLIFGFVVDGFLPDFLKKATDGTILYEDLADDWESRAQVNQDLLTKWISLNVLNGTISPEKNFYTIRDKADFADEKAFQNYVTSSANASGLIVIKDTSIKEELTTKVDNKTVTDKTKIDALVAELSYYDNSLYNIILNEYIPFEANYKHLQYENQRVVALCFTKALTKVNTKLQNEGVKNENTAMVLKNNFQSMDRIGYKTFSDCALPYANGSRLTIPVLVHLILDPREVKYYFTQDANGDVTSTTEVQILRDYEEYTPADTTKNYASNLKLYVKYTGDAELDNGFIPATDAQIADATVKKYTARLYYFYNQATGKVELTDFRWTILDMDGKVMNVNLYVAGIGSAEVLSGVTVSELLKLPQVEQVYVKIAELIADEELASATLGVFIKLDGDNLTIMLRPNNTVRGMMGYQNMAWLDSNGLVFLLCSLFSIRTLFYIFAGVIAMLTIAIGLIRAKQAELKGSCNCAACDCEHCVDYKADDTTEDLVDAIEQIKPFAEEELSSGIPPMDVSAE